MTAQNCTTCDSPLRPARRTEKELPGTKPLATNQTCRPCYDRAYREKKRAALEPTLGRGREGIREDFDLRHATYALNSFLANLPSRKAAA